MKNIIQSINEAKQISYHIAFVECPMITVEILVDKNNQTQFEKFLTDEEGNTFAHVNGGNIEY